MSEVVFGPHRIVVGSIYELAPSALEEIALWIEERGLRTPISQIIGFKQFTAQSDAIGTLDSTFSLGWATLGTAGPVLNSLTDGNYLAFFGFTGHSTDTVGGDYARMGLAINGNTSDADNHAATTGGPAEQSVSHTQTVRLAAGAGGNTLEAVYRTDGGAQAYFHARWLIALRTSNL